MTARRIGGALLSLFDEKGWNYVSAWYDPEGVENAIYERQNVIQIQYNDSGVVVQEQDPELTRTWIYRAQDEAYFISQIQVSVQEWTNSLIALSS